MLPDISRRRDVTNLGESHRLTPHAHYGKYNIVDKSLHSIGALVSMSIFL